MGKASIVFLLFAGSFIVRNRTSVSVAFVKIVHQLVMLYLRSKNAIKLLLKNKKTETRRSGTGSVETDDPVADSVKPSVGHQAFRAMLIAAQNPRTTLKTWRLGANLNPGFCSVFLDASVKSIKMFSSSDIMGEQHSVRTLEVAASGLDLSHPGEAPEERQSRDIIVYLHGGGYVASCPETYLGVLAKLSHHCQMLVYAPDYRKCPEATMQEQLADCLQSYQYLTDEMRYLPQRIFLVGDSAGAGLALGLMQKLLTLKLKTPRAAVFISPYADLEASGESYTTNATNEEIVLPGYTEVFKKACCPRGDPSSMIISKTFTILLIFAFRSDLQLHKWRI